MKTKKWLFMILIIVAFPSFLHSGVLDYRIIKKQDISFANIQRIVYRVVLEVKAIPTEQDMQNTAQQIWQKDLLKWDEFTVLMYLPDMDMNYSAYCVAEINKDGLIKLRIQQNSLYETKWEPKKEQPKNTPINTEKLKDYYVSIKPEILSNRRVKVYIETNFPDGTNMLLTIERHKYLKGKEELYSGQIYDEYFTVKESGFERIVTIDDSEWYNEHLRLVKALPEDIMPIEKISDNINISVLYTAMKEQPEKVTSILGLTGEFVGGKGASRLGKMTVFRESKELNVPFSPDKVEGTILENDSYNYKPNYLLFIIIVGAVVLILIIRAAKKSHKKNNPKLD